MVVAQVDVDLVDAAILDARSDAGDRRLESGGILAVRVKVGRQENGVGGQLGGFHQPHAGKHAECACRIG